MASSILEPGKSYLIRYPPLVADEDRWRLTICPYFSQPPLRDIANDIARLYDISELTKQLFPNRETHPVIHEHETAMHLLKEADYVQHVQIMMHWLGVDESTDTLLTFPNLNINDEPAPSQPQPPTQQPTQPPTQQRSNFAGLQRGFLTNTEPRPLLYHYTTGFFFLMAMEVDAL